MTDRSMGHSGPPPRPAIVQAITRLNIGGPGRHVLDVATGLGDRYEMRVATGRAPDVEGELSTHGVAIERLPLVRSIDVQRDAKSVIGMRRLLRRHKTQLVHSHTAKAGAIARVAASSIKPRPRIVHTFHGHVLAGYFSPRAESVFAQVERHLARRSDLLITVSAEIRDALLDLGIGRPSQYEVLALGVDLEPFLAVDGPSGYLRGTLGLAADVPLVGVIARLAPVKDHSTLLEAMAGLPGVHLAVLGDGELRQALQADAQRLGVRDRTHFLQWWHDMPTALADLDVVVLASRNEGTPMALIEAGAAGKPVVATSVGGVPGVVLDGRSGILVAPGSPPDMASAIRALLDDPDRRQQLGRTGRQHVVSNFGLHASLSAMDAIYEDLLTERPR